MFNKYEISYILSDWSVNKDLRVKFFLVYFRLARVIYLLRIPIFSKLFTSTYYALTSTIFNCELHPATKIGTSLCIHHPHLIIINPRSVLGSNITLRHGVTIGNIGNINDSCPTIGDNVEFGAYAAVLGPIVIPSGTKLKFRSLHYIAKEIFI